MKKRLISATLVLAGIFIMSGSLVYAKDYTFRWTKFYNDRGETVYYRVPEPKNIDINDPAIHMVESAAPETAEIGDIFQSENGYERVFAVSEDGAYMTETFSTYEEACNAGK